MWPWFDPKDLIVSLTCDSLTPFKAFGESLSKRKYCKKYIKEISLSSREANKIKPFKRKAWNELVKKANLTGSASAIRIHTSTSCNLPLSLVFENPWLVLPVNIWEAFKQMYAVNQEEPYQFKAAHNRLMHCVMNMSDNRLFIGECPRLNYVSYLSQAKWPDGCVLLVCWVVE